MVAGGGSWEPPFEVVAPSAIPSTCPARIASLRGKSFSRGCYCSQAKLPTLIELPRSDLPVRFAPSPMYSGE
jgi:hypothetical protein